MAEPTLFYLNDQKLYHFVVIWINKNWRLLGIECKKHVI